MRFSMFAELLKCYKSFLYMEMSASDSDDLKFMEANSNPTIGDDIIDESDAPEDDEIMENTSSKHKKKKKVVKKPKDENVGGFLASQPIPTMASSCIIDDGDSNSKKRKSSEDEDIYKSQKGVKVVDRKDSRKHSVTVTFQFSEANSSSDEELKSAFSSLLKEAGCPESVMSSYDDYCFFANLTEEQAKKLSGVNHVRSVYPSTRFCCPESVEAMRRVS